MSESFITVTTDLRLNPAHIVSVEQTGTRLVIHTIGDKRYDIEMRDVTEEARRRLAVFLE